MLDIAHIHPMLIHFPLALMPVALVAQGLALARGQSLFGRDCASSSGMLLVILAAAGAVLAAIFGDMALDQAVASGVPLGKLEGHEELGILSASALAGLAVLEGWFYVRKYNSRRLSWAAFLAGLILTGLLLLTAYYGGNLVYGLGVNVATGG